MKTLFAAVALAVAAPAAAQTSGVAVYQAGRFAVVAPAAGVTPVVAVGGYLLAKPDFDEVCTIEMSDCYEIRRDGLFLDGSVHGPSLTSEWTSFVTLRDIADALAAAERRHKKKGPEELSARCESLRSKVRQLTIEKRADDIASSMTERMPGRLHSWDAASAASELDRLELAALKAKTSLELATASLAIDLFAAALPK